MTISLQSGQQSPKDYSQLCCHGGWAAGGGGGGGGGAGGGGVHSVLESKLGLVQPRAVYIIPPPPPPTRILLPFPFCTEGGSPHLLAAATARENGLRRVYLECVCFHICSEADRGTYKCAALGKWNTPPSGETLRLKYIAVWWNCPLWGEWNTPPSGETLRLKYIAVWWNCPLWGEWNTPPSGETLRFKYIAVWWNCPLWGEWSVTEGTEHTAAGTHEPFLYACIMVVDSKFPKKQTLQESACTPLVFCPHLITTVAMVCLASPR